MSEIQKSVEQESLPLLQIIGTIVDNEPYDGQINPNLMKNIPLNVLVDDNLNNTADRIACLLHLKMLRSATSVCKKATVVIQINNKDKYFIARCKNKKWTGEWQTPEMRKQAYINATERLAFLNNF
jgi:hypothetical protein